MGILRNSGKFSECRTWKWIAKSLHINDVLWEEILAKLEIEFLNPIVEIIICIRITQYPTKEQNLIIESDKDILGKYKISHTKIYTTLTLLCSSV